MATWDQIRAGIFAGESGGDYDALYGYSNRDGGRFANTRLTDMTVGDAINFSAPGGDYGQWVKGRIGRVATPMGAYQVVGTTLRDAVRGLGLAGDERMTPELQDKIGRWVYDQQGTGAWEGYRGPQDPQAPSYRMSTKGATDMPTYTMPERDQAPRGLLGMLGIEKRDESAGGQTAQPFYQRDRFKDTMGNLAMAFNEMRLNPSDAIPAIVSRQQDKRQDAAQSSRTAAWLRSQGREDLASAVETGTLGGKDAVALAYAPAKDDRTSQIKNYEYWLSKGKTPEEAARLVDAGTNITVGGSDANAMNEVFDKGVAEQALEALAVGGQAQRNAIRYNALEDALANAPQGGRGAFVGFASNLGLKFDGASDVEAATAIINALVPEQRAEGSGPMSDADLELFKQSLPRIINTPDGNRRILETLRNIAAYDSGRAALARSLMSGELNRGSYLAALYELPNPLEAYRRSGGPAAASGADTMARDEAARILMGE